jgi:hypothetical protein
MGVNLQHLLIHSQFWVLELQFVLVVVTTVIEMPRFLRQLSRPGATVAAALALSMFAWTLATFVAPRTSRIYYDEQIYQGIGQNLSDLHLAQMCNDGTVEDGRLQCSRGEYNKEPNGYPYLLSFVYRIAGVSEGAAFRLNNVVAGLAAGVAVLLSAVLFEDLLGAVLGGLMLTLMPMQITWSNTAAAEPSAALFAAFGLLTAVWFARARTTSALAWTVAVLAFATMFRPESILVVPLAGAAVVLLAPRELARARLWWAVAIGLLLTAMTWMHLLAVRGESWGTSGSRLAWSYAAVNLPVNFWFYVRDLRFPVLFSAAALAGLVAPGFRREKALVAGFFAAFWSIFVFFYAGSYNYGADVRYSLLSNLPLAVLAGVGASWMAGNVSVRWPRARPSVVVPAILLFQFLWYVPLVRATGEEAWGSRADVVFAREFARSLPPNAIVLTHNPAMFHVWGVNAVQMSIATTDRSYVDGQLFARYAGGVFLHWNFWCNVADPTQVAFCNSALNGFGHDLVAEHRVRDYRYALYRLRLR